MTRFFLMTMCILLAVGCRKAPSTPPEKAVTDKAGGGDKAALTEAARPADADKSKNEQPAGQVTKPETKPEAAEAAEAAAQTAAQGGAQEQPAANIGDAAAVLAGLEWVKGGPVEMAKGGKVHVIEFWATWCPPCRESIPHLTKVQKAFKDKGVVIVGISTETIDKVKPFVEQMADKMDYNVAIDREGNMDKQYMAAFKQNGIPTAFIVSKEGRIVWVGHPMGDMEEVLEQVVGGTFDHVAYAKKQAQLRAIQEERQKNFMGYFENVTIPANTEQAAEYAKKIMADKDPEVLGGFAITILTQPEQKDRDINLALSAIQKAKELSGDKVSAGLQISHAIALLDAGKPQEAKEYSQKVLAENDPQILNSFARIIMTAVEEKNRDNIAALLAVKKANELTKGENPAVLDTYAMALFNTGKLMEAVDVQAKAVELTKDNPRRNAAMKKTLEKYQSAVSGTSISTPASPATPSAPAAPAAPVSAQPAP